MPTRVRVQDAASAIEIRSPSTCLNCGTSLRHIETLLGHGSPKTTEIYTHVSQGDLRRIPNPLDASP